MPRPLTKRRVCCCPRTVLFKPAGIPARDLEEVVLSFDEAEAVRLGDGEGLYQQAAARRMGVSRQTYGRILESARRKIADALLGGKALRIGGGKITWEEGEKIMKIAVPVKDGMVDGHFGHCEGFSVYSVDEKGSIKSEETVPSPAGCGCKSNIGSVLAGMGVTHLIAGGMGEGAVRVLASNGINVVRGISGSARTAAEALAGGTLKDTGVNCVGHGHGGDCN
jgi:predicted DNA-binding protein (UPF0251 family)/predicted Fe-Mo cluster-binding NifX family protein